MRRWRDAKRAAEAEADLTSALRYNAFYSRYIHRKGYLRIDVGREVAEIYITPRSGGGVRRQISTTSPARLNCLREMMKDEKIRKAMKSLDENLCKGSLRPLPVGVKTGLLGGLVSLRG